MLRSGSFTPKQDIPDLAGKVILVTGGNVGLGKETIEQLSQHNPSQIYLAARTPAKADAAIEDIKSRIPNAPITRLDLDLTSFDSIRAAADTFRKSSNDRLDILINNAGIMACPAGLTKDGYEIQFGTNHMGHALLTKLLLPALKKTATEHGEARVVNLSSGAERWAPKQGLILDQCKTDMASSSTWARYGQSKLANIHFSREFARQNPDIKCVAVHPGAVGTNLWTGPGSSYPAVAWTFKYIMPLITVSVHKGAWNQEWASVSDKVKSGAFYFPVGKETPGTPNAQNESLTKELWEWTEKELQSHGY